MIERMSENNRNFEFFDSVTRIAKLRKSKNRPKKPQFIAFHDLAKQVTFKGKERLSDWIQSDLFQMDDESIEKIKNPDETECSFSKDGQFSVSPEDLDVSGNCRWQNEILATLKEFLSLKLIKNEGKLIVIKKGWAYAVVVRGWNGFIRAICAFAGVDQVIFDEDAVEKMLNIERTVEESKVTKSKSAIAKSSKCENVSKAVPLMQLDLDESGDESVDEERESSSGDNSSESKADADEEPEIEERDLQMSSSELGSNASKSERSGIEDGGESSDDDGDTAFSFVRQDVFNASLEELFTTLSAKMDKFMIETTKELNMFKRRMEGEVSSLKKEVKDMDSDLCDSVKKIAGLSKLQSTNWVKHDSFKAEIERMDGQMRAFEDSNKAFRERTAKQVSTNTSRSEESLNLAKSAKKSVDTKVSDLEGWVEKQIAEIAFNDSASLGSRVADLEGLTSKLKIKKNFSSMQQSFNLMTEALTATDKQVEKVTEEVGVCRHNLKKVESKLNRFDKTMSAAAVKPKLCFSEGTSLGAGYTTTK